MSAGGPPTSSGVISSPSDSRLRAMGEPVLLADAGAVTGTAAVTGTVATTDAVLPLYAEEIAVARRNVERRVQVHVHTVTREHPVDELLTHERVEIERVAIGRPVDAIPADREEGDTTVIPVVEEVVVVHRQLVLREELRIRRVRVTEHHRETVSLRAQEAVVERFDPEPDTTAVVPGATAPSYPMKDQVP